MTYIQADFYFLFANKEHLFSVTLESSVATQWFAEDTFISHNVIKRVWPASQRDALFWSHIRHVPGQDEDSSSRWIVVNFSTEDPNIPVRLLSLMWFLTIQIS